MKQIPSGQDEGGFDEVACGEKHAKWVGVLLSFLTTGASQFLAGHRKRGLCWFIGVNVVGMVGLMVMASSLFQRMIPALVIWAVFTGLWIFMLCDAYRPVPKMGFWKWLLTVAVCISINYLTRSAVVLLVQPFIIPTNAMAPTVRGNSPAKSAQKYKGDKILVEKFAYWFNKPQRGDIIVFKNEWMTSTRGSPFLMRAAGLPGEKVSVKMGKLFVNGYPVTKPRVFTRIAYTNPALSDAKYLRTPDEEYTVPAGHYFVLGDNSERSADSRYFGAVPEKNIIGKATKIYWPPERIGVLE